MSSTEHPAKEYVRRLQETETYKAKVILAIEEYALRGNRIWFKSLPPLPTADDDRHIVVIETTSKEPSIYAVLSKSGQQVNPSLRLLDNLLFVFCSVKPTPLTVPTMSGGYQLKDGQRLDVNFDIVFRISDVKAFWQAAEDPIKLLRSEIAGEARKYLLRLSSMDLISGQLDVEHSLEQRMHMSQISTLVQGLENKVQGAAIGGIELIRVHAAVSLSKELQDVLDRMRAHVLGPRLLDSRGKRGRETIERRDMDTIIDQDRTYAPYSLRDIIRKLDQRLLENFYSMDYSAAMRQLHESFERAKAKYYEQQHNADMLQVDKWQKALETAERTVQDQMVIDEIRERIGKKLLESIDNDATKDDRLRIDFIEHELGVMPAPHLLASSSEAP